MAKSDTTTTMLTITAGITMSENQAADKGGTIVILCEDPPCDGPNLDDSNVWIVEFPYRLKHEN